MGLSLRKLGSIAQAVERQVNPFDNGMTAKQATPTTDRPLMGQVTHNGITNTVGNLLYKPFVENPWNVGKDVAGVINNQRFGVDNTDTIAKLKEHLHSSVPGFVVDNVTNFGKAVGNVPQAIAGEVTGNRVATENAARAGLKAFNKTTVGQALSPVQAGIDAVVPTAMDASRQAGYDTKGTGAKKFFADPLMGGLATYGMVKSGAHISDKLSFRVGETPTVAPVETPVAPGVPAGAPTEVPTSATKINVRSVPSDAELQTRFNTRAAVLEDGYKQEMTQAMKKPMATRDALARQIDAKYEALHGQLVDDYSNGSLAKNIEVKDAPKSSIKVKTESVTSPKEVIKASNAVEKAKVTLKAITDAPSADSKAPNAIKRSYQSTRDVIAQHGEGGKEIARRLDEQRSASEVGQEAFAETIPSVLKLKQADFTTFVDTLEKLSKGEEVLNVPDHIGQAINEWRQAIPGIRNRAVTAGLDVGDLGENYFPREYKGLNKAGKVSAMADEMVKSGKAKTRGEAIDAIRHSQQDYQRAFGNLERNRLADLPGYEKTHDALLGYISRSFERITKAEQFGAKSELLNELRAKVAADGFDSAKDSTFDRQLKIALKDVDKSTVAHKVSGKVRQVNAIRSLSTSAISNATQLTNTATVGGVFKTLKAIGKILTSPDERFAAKQSGVLLDHTINALAEQGLGTTGKITKNIASPFFNVVEKFNRQVTAVVGKDFAESLAEKARNGNAGAEAILRDKLGVKGEIGETLTREQQIQASRGMVEISQFKVDPMDLPGWVDSPMGKLAAQFRTFGYKQTKFMWNEVLREATKGNMMPLVRFTMVGIPAGTAAIAIKGALRGQNNLNGDKKSIAAKALAQVGAGGLPVSEGVNMANSVKYGDTVGGVASLVGGPTGSVIAETGNNLDKARKGDSTALQKEAVRNIPLVGSSLAPRVFAAPETPKQGTTGKKKEDATKELADYKATVAKGSGEGSGMQQLSDGRYVYNIGGEVKTTTDKKAAQKAIAKDDFSKSDASSKTIGDTYYYKDESGDVKTQPVALHEFNQSSQKNSLAMDVAYRASDLGAWAEAANKQVDALEAKKKMYNPETEGDKIDAITNQQQDLLYKLQGYQKKGINGVGGAASKRAAQALDMNINRYTVSAKNAPVPKLTVASTGSSGHSKISYRTIAKPKVSLKKSKV